MTKSLTYRYVGNNMFDCMMVHENYNSQLVCYDSEGLADLLNCQEHDLNYTGDKVIVDFWRRRFVKSDASYNQLLFLL